MKTKVCKFGGSSVANAEQILKVFAIARSDAQRRAVVVSAPGKRFKGDDKVTDLLIDCASRVITGGEPEKAIERVVERYEEIGRDLGLPREFAESFRADLIGRLSRSAAKKTAAFIDSIKAMGEEYSARFCAAAFAARGLNAVYVDPKDAGMLLSDEYGAARLLPESYDLLAKNLSSVKGTIIFPGFYGFTRDGEVATFSRGGSDITGAILAVALKADVYENFTDVDAVFPVDPRLCPEVAEKKRGIDEMTYAEMRELSYAGFGVFHDEAVMPAITASIPINIRNTNHPDEPGTMILPERKTIPGRVNGIATETGFGALYVEKWLMNREVGYVARLLSILADEGVSIEMIPAGVDSVSVIFRDSVFPLAIRDRVMERIRKELAPDKLSYNAGLAFICAVGEGMRQTVGTCLHVVSALSKAGVNLQIINQGSSEISIMFGVRESDIKPAVRALYREFFE